MYGQPRAATVIAVTDGSLWALDRHVFRAVMKKLTSVDPTRELTRALRKISLLRQLNLQQIQRLLQLMKETVIHEGDVLIHKGQVLDTLYLITSGTCQDAVEAPAHAEHSATASLSSVTVTPLGSSNDDATSTADNQVRSQVLATKDTSVKESQVSHTYVPTGHKYEAYDSVTENGLVDEVNHATSTVIAITDVKVLCIARATFEDAFGPLQEVIDIQVRRRESFSRGLPVASAATVKLDNNALKGTVHVDSLGVVLIGHFGSIAGIPIVGGSSIAGSTSVSAQIATGLLPPLHPHASSGSHASVGSHVSVHTQGSAGSGAHACNVTVRTFLLKEVEKNNLSACVRNIMLVVRTIVAYSNTTRNSVPAIEWCLPKYHSLLRDSNAIHLLFKEVIIGDLADVVHQLVEMQSLAEQAQESQCHHTAVNPPLTLSQIAAAAAAAPTATAANAPVSVMCDEKLAAYITSSVVRAIEVMHGMGIVFRSLQPEAIHVSVDGKVMLCDYKQAKVAAIGTRSYTLCGATDYLAPEQITNAGYGGDVDLWATGVLLFELICGENPFAAKTEVGVYQNIAAYGSPKFRSLRFANHASNLSVDLINSLIVPDASKRLGAGIAKNSLVPLKKHEFFSGMDWDPASTTSSTAPSGGITHQSSQQYGLGTSSNAPAPHNVSWKQIPPSTHQSQPYQSFYQAQARMASVAQAIYAELIMDGVDVDVVANFSVPYYGTRWDRDLEC
jgi:serine/threonine protein kinase/CRP-like cAMP-binding protein